MNGSIVFWCLPAGEEALMKAHSHLSGIYFKFLLDGWSRTFVAFWLASRATDSGGLSSVPVVSLSGPWGVLFLRIVCIRGSNRWVDRNSRPDFWRSCGSRSVRSRREGCPIYCFVVSYAVCLLCAAGVFGLCVNEAGRSNRSSLAA